MLSSVILEKLTDEHLNYLEKFHDIKLPPKTNKLYDDILALLFYGKKGERIDNMRFYPPVSEQELTDWESENAITMPELYKELIVYVTC